VGSRPTSRLWGRRPTVQVECGGVDQRSDLAVEVRVLFLVEDTIADEVFRIIVPLDIEVPS
jgi:hypothetical protein